MKLSIVIVSWNTKQLLQECLDSLYQNPPTSAYEVWVVDNASSDDSAAMVAAEFPQANLITNQKNAGFAQANNQAIVQSTGQYTLLLNPDTVVHANAFDELVAFMDAYPEAGGAGSYLLNTDGSLQVSCYPAPTIARELWRLFYLDRLYPYGEYHMHKWDETSPREVDILKGASVLFRKKILDQIGFMDGDYFMYSEETDLCYRVQRAGWKLFWVPQSQITHYGSQSTKLVRADMFLQLYQGKLKYFRKHYGKRSGMIYKMILYFAAIVRLLATPLIWLQGAAKRKHGMAMAQHYRRLITTLPTM